MKHGYARQGAVHPVHRVWRMMLDRCDNPNNKRFENYGGRGIKVHPRWRSFEKFIADVGARPPGVGAGGRALYSLERKNNDGNYAPGNVVWATASEQVRNSRKVLNRKKASCRHPNRKIRTSGMCSECYEAKRKADSEARAARRPTCHPEREYCCKGLCSKCYMRAYHAQKAL